MRFRQHDIELLLEPLIFNSFFLNLIGSASSKNFINFKDANDRKVSTSRLDRFKSGPRNFTNGSQLDLGSDLCNENDDGCEVQDKISVGDWCVFSSDSNSIVSQIIGFQYLSGKNKSYSWLTAPIKPPTSSQHRGIGVLGNMYNIEPTGNLVQAKRKIIYINIKDYVYHLRAKPLILNDVLKTTSNVYKQIKLIC